MPLRAFLLSCVLMAASMAVRAVDAHAATAPDEDAPAPPPVAVYIVEPMAWRDIDCREYGGSGTEECPHGDQRVHYRLVEALRGPAWTGERAFDGSFNGAATGNARVLLVVRKPDGYPEYAPIDRVAGGGWAYCGVPPHFEEGAEAGAIQPLEFVDDFGDTRRWSAHGIESHVEPENHAIVGHAVRCRRGVPLAALLRWLDAGGELW